MATAIQGTALNTLSAMDVLNQAQAAEVQRQKDLAAQTAGLQGEAQQAQQQYQQAAAQPSPQVNPMDFLAAQLFGNLASVVTRSEAPRERVRGTVTATQTDILKKRAENVSHLRDVYETKAQQAQKASDLESEENYRNKIHRIDQTLGLLKESIKASAGGLGGDTVKWLADGVESGRISPDLKGYYKWGPLVRAELERRGFNQNAAYQDYAAKMTYYKNLNSNLQIKYNQAVDSAFGVVQYAQQLNDDLGQVLDRNDIRALNSLNLSATQDWNVHGPEVAAAVSKLRGQITLIQDALASVYSQGGVPTDVARQMAMNVINLDMPPQSLQAAFESALKDLNIREGVIKEAHPRLPSAEGKAANVAAPPAAPVRAPEATPNAAAPTKAANPKDPAGLFTDIMKKQRSR